MANIDLQITPPPTTFPFTALPGVLQKASSVPRARITYRIANQVIAAKIATNTGSIFAILDLPPNYAYIVEYMYCSVQFLTDIDDAGHYDNLGQLQFQDGLGTRHVQMVSGGLMNNDLNSGSMKVWAPVNNFTVPWFRDGGGIPRVIAGIWDDDAVNATQAGVYQGLFTFLQFDLNQAFNLDLNFALPVQVRGSSGT